MLPTGWGEHQFLSQVICTFMDIVLDDGYKVETD